MSETLRAAPMTRKSASSLRLRFPVACVIAFWAAFLVIGTIEKLYFYSFLSQLASTALFTLLFFGWWFFNRGLKAKQKIGGFLLIVAGAFIVARFMDRSMNPFILARLGVPMVATAVLLWFKRARRIRAPFVGTTFALVVFGIWSLFLLLRSEGADSALKQSYFLRWTPSAEEKFLAVRPSPNPPKHGETSALTPGTNQWTQFRGASRDGSMFGTSIPTNWTVAPALLWKRPVGPAWSSMILVGPRLFTQEQRGASEAVVCYDAATGEEIWSHEDNARFEESLAGVGPRATPTFRDGKIFTLGATGLLNCLDAASGKPLWQSDIRVDSGARVMQWGFSSSPLVVEDKVIVYAGGARGLLAYNADNGNLTWTSAAGQTSYSSPQASVILGVTQCLMLHDGGLMSVDIASGKQIWLTGFSFPDGPRSNQPHIVGTNEIIAGGANNSISSASTSFFKVGRAGGAWSVSTNWITKEFKPEFPDIVVHKGHAYGFDVNLFACISLADGKRQWKEGRYGRGQVVLLADQNALLVASETGDLVLLAADPTTHREFGRFKALEGKTWAGPVVDGEKIYHRNAQEMACYTFGPAAKPLAKN